MINTIRKASFDIDFNQKNRDNWVKKIALKIPADSNILDVGAGTCRYSHLFKHCNYLTQDFLQYSNTFDNSFNYGEINCISDITSSPFRSEIFDVVLCTEVLEHVSEPIQAIKELSRILKKKGRLYLTTPLGAGLHMMPHHYYGGFTPSFFEKFFKKFNLKLMKIEPNGGLLKHFVQESNRVGNKLLEYLDKGGSRLKRARAQKFFVKLLFKQFIPSYLYNLDNKIFDENFTVGYFIIGEKC